MWFTSHRNLGMAIGIAVMTLFLLFVGVVPIYQHASGLLKKIESKTSELEALNSKVTLLTQLDQGILQERVSTLDKALPPKKDVLLYLTSIDGLSRELGLTFGGLSLTPGEITEATVSGAKKAVKPRIGGSGLQGLETEIRINGGKDSIYTFLRTIEEVLPLMQINDVKVTVLPSEQYSLSLKLNMLWAEPATIDVKSKITLFGEEEDKYFQQMAQYRQFESIITTSPISGVKSDLFAPFTIETVETVSPIPLQ